VLVGATPYTLTSSLPALISLWGRDKRPVVWNGSNGAGRTSWCLFLMPIIENSNGDGSLGPAKNKFGTVVNRTRHLFFLLLST
jgi:hypothetical protein